VELFLFEEGILLIHEVALRPRNSGHFTFGPCVASQIEQYLHAICGLPLGDTTFLFPVVRMNLLGNLWGTGRLNGIAA